MTPSNQDIVDAAKRAGINLSMEGTSHLWIDRNIGPKQIINLGDDSIVGSALFIVAVLGVLPCALACRSYSVDGKWVGWDVHWVGGDDDPLARADTLTEACACALVAAYPEKPTDE